MAATALDLEAVRAQFPALASGVAFLDAPGGTQCSQSVIDAIAAYLRESNANLGGAFAASLRSDELVARAHETAAGPPRRRPRGTQLAPQPTAPPLPPHRRPRRP